MIGRNSMRFMPAGPTLGAGSFNIPNSFNGQPTHRFYADGGRVSAFDVIREELPKWWNDERTTDLRKGARQTALAPVYLAMPGLAALGMGGAEMYDAFLRDDKEARDSPTPGSFSWMEQALGRDLHDPQEERMALLSGIAQATPIVRDIPRMAKWAKNKISPPPGIRDIDAADFLANLDRYKASEGHIPLYHRTSEAFDTPNPGTWFTSDPDQIAAMSHLGDRVKMFEIPESSPMAEIYGRGRGFNTSLGELTGENNPIVKIIEEIKGLDPSTSYVVNDPSLLRELGSSAIEAPSRRDFLRKAGAVGLGAAGAAAGVGGIAKIASKLDALGALDSPVATSALGDAASVAEKVVDPARAAKAFSSLSDIVGNASSKIFNKDLLRKAAANDMFNKRSVDDVLDDDLMFDEGRLSQFMLDDSMDLINSPFKRGFSEDIVDELSKNYDPSEISKMFGGNDPNEVIKAIYRELPTKSYESGIDVDSWDIDDNFLDEIVKGTANIDHPLQMLENLRNVPADTMRTITEGLEPGLNDKLNKAFESLKNYHRYENYRTPEEMDLEHTLRNIEDQYGISVPSRGLTSEQKEDIFDRLTTILDEEDALMELDTLTKMFDESNAIKKRYGLPGYADGGSVKSPSAIEQFLSL